MDYTQFLNALAQSPSNGVFLITGPGEPNVMTISWGQCGHIWGKPILTVMVRQSRYTHALLEKSGFFTISVPKPNEFTAQLAHCGSVSGRDENKLSIQGLSLLPARAGGVGGIAGCARHYECRTVFRAESDLRRMDQAILANYYPPAPHMPGGDAHTIYFGEVLAAYGE